MAPLVARHFDFLDGLASSAEPGRSLTVPLAELGAALNRVSILIGSAPVGPTTVARLQQYAHKLPLVRFGSTETCLQVVGTPRGATEEEPGTLGARRDEGEAGRRGAPAEE